MYEVLEASMKQMASEACAAMVERASFERSPDILQVSDQVCETAWAHQLFVLDPHMPP